MKGHPMTTEPATIAATMRAVTQSRYGSSQVLQVTRVPRPTIAADGVLVQVRAAGLDRGTEHLMTGKPYAVRLGFGIRTPKNPVPGRDVAGIVVEVGPSVTRFTVGDAVYGVAPGSFAEYAAASEAKLAPMPKGLTFAQAAVVPVSASTAFQALHDVGSLAPGQSVLVLGASGGVGTYAVQLAKAHGAQVTGACSTAKLDLVSSLGADHVLDYTQQDFADGTRTYDLILDIGGNPSLTRLRRALNPRGTAVFVGSENSGNFTGMGRQMRGALIDPLLSQRLALLLAKERAADYERLTTFIEAGQVSPSLERTFPLEDAPEAMRLLEGGQVRGKIAITV
jgi:NADPH:quinone reductase-like Zn-dependent oxidoreductase